MPNTPDIKRDPMKEFQNNIVKKLREDIAATLPQDVLDKLVQRAVNETFFNRIIEHDKYHHVTKDEPSWFVQAVAEQAKPLIKELINHYVKDNEHIIENAFKEFISEHSITLTMVEAMRNQSRDLIMEAAEQIISRMKQSY